MKLRLSLLPSLLSIALGSLGLPAVAFAAPTPVLVSAFQPTSAAGRTLATLLENYLAQEIALDATLKVVRIEDTRDFEDYSARVYIEGCPPSDIVGCTSIIAERGAAEFAVTGTVRTSVDGSEVELEILDIQDSRVVVSFKSAVASGEDKVFAQGVARVLAAAVRGEIGEEHDIRSDGQEAPARKLDNDAVARQIAQLSKDLGEVSIALTRPDKGIAKPVYTVDDVARQSQTDGVKPWEHLGMTPGAYLRYKNSGLSLMEWRARAVGRKQQLLITPLFGYANGAMAGGFYGAYATDDSTAVVESWSAQSQQTAGGAWINGVVSYGLLPELDVGVSVGLQTGQFTVDVDNYVVDQSVEPTEPEVFPASRVTVGARANLALLPTRSIRPRFGAGVDWMQGYGVGQFLQLPPWIAVFDAPSLIVGQVDVGGEARISKRVDFVLQVPVTLLLTGSNVSTAHTGTQSVVATTSPERAGLVGVGVSAGLQVRLFGARADARAADEIDAIDGD
jgi:hypothetical protein